MRRLALLLCTLGPATLCGDIHFDNFARRPPELQLVGEAKIRHNVLRLTPAEQDSLGAAWLREKQSVRGGFDTSFRFQLSRPDRFRIGADGFAFVIQKAGPRAKGGPGSAGGFSVADANYHHKGGIPWSFAVFFDTYQNGGEGDPSDNFISVRIAGRPSDLRWPAERAAIAPVLPINLKDARAHRVHIVYQTPILRVYLDDSAEPVLQTTLDLSLTADNEGKAWVGFTASTGTESENHDILDWTFSSQQTVVSSAISFSMAACLPDRNLCTPDEPTVKGDDRRFHVVLPANLLWGARIANAHGASVVISNARGIVCRDPRRLGSNGCSGPQGDGSPDAGFLDGRALPGALISRTHDGSTWFSVNSRDSEFKTSEGFYEFDVELR